MKKEIILGIIGIPIAIMTYRAYTVVDPNAAVGTSIMLRFGATVLAGVYVGLLAVFYLLPIFSNKVTDMVFSDNGIAAEPDSLSKARGLVAMGEYEEAIKEYNNALEHEPDNRLAWTDIAKIYADKLEQPGMAIATYRTAFNDHEWEEDDAAFFLFRISEWQIDDLDDRFTAIETLQEIIAKFPGTRHSANATNQLRQLGIEPS